MSVDIKIKPPLEAVARTGRLLDNRYPDAIGDSLGCGRPKHAQSERGLRNLKQKMTPPRATERSEAAVMVVAACLVLEPVMLGAWSVGAMAPVPLLFVSAALGMIGFMALPGAVGVRGQPLSEEVENG